MKTRIPILIALAGLGTLPALALSGPSAARSLPVSAPMRTVLLPPIAAPVATTTTTAAPTTTTTMTTTPPPVQAPPPAPAAVVPAATPNPVQDQAPPSPSQCEVWIPASMIFPPTTEPMLIYGGACDQANAIAAAHPGWYVTPQ